MRIVVQRVTTAEVSIAGIEKARIPQGFLILLGITADDDETDIDWLVQKITGLRVFADPEGKMNLDIRQIRGEILVVSQFTLHASTRKGNRPSFLSAARPEQAVPLYARFLDTLGRMSGVPIASGVFGADMQIALVNDGPVTLIIDSKLRE